MTNLMQILDQIKNQFPVPVFSWGHFIPFFMGVFYPFDRDRFFRALAWLIMHKIVYPSVIARLIVHKITFYASLRAVADGAAIHA